MKNQVKELVIAVIVTAITVGGGIYYFFGEKEIKPQNLILNQSSKEYAIMGRQVWSAFQCSAWASSNEDAKEGERLFLFAYKQGKTFISAARANKITKEDYSNEVPIGISFVSAGPSDDFILGRIYSAAQEDALEEVLQTGEKYNSEEMQKIIASNKYRDGNCQLIGN